MAEALSTKKATELIRSLATDDKLSLFYKLHAKEQMSARNIIVSDVLFALRNGFVRKEAQAATQNGFFKYAIESRTPNSDNREIRIIVIPDGKRKHMKLVTIMWVDERSARDGSIVGEMK